MASYEETPLFHLHITTLNSDGSKFYNRGLFLVIIFFSVIVSTITLFLFTHLVCRCCRLFNTSSGTSSTTVLSQASQGLDPETIDSLPVILVTVDSVGGAVTATECSICLSMYEDKEKVKVLAQCNHAYHSECIDKWLRSQSSCPLCRVSLVQSETAHEQSFV